MAIVKVAREHEVESLSLTGWALKEIRETDAVETMQIAENVPQYPGAPQGVTYRLIKGEEQKVCRSLRFIMEKDDASVVGAQTERINELESQVCALEDERRIWKPAQEKLSKELVGVQSILESERVADKAERAARFEAQRSLHVMEEDIAKIRKEVGEAEMRRILGR